MFLCMAQQQSKRADWAATRAAPVLLIECNRQSSKGNSTRCQRCLVAGAFAAVNYSRISMGVHGRVACYKRGTETDSGGRGLVSVPSHTNMSTPPATLPPLPPPPPAPCCFTAGGASSGRTATTYVLTKLAVELVKELTTSKQDCQDGCKTYRQH